MVAGLRCLAVIIDVPLCFGTMILALQGLIGVINWLQVESLLLGVLAFFLMCCLICFWSFLYFCIPTAIWGRTPGRWMCCIRVVDEHGSYAGFWKGLGRETLKVISLATGIGAVVGFVMAVSEEGRAWYDYLCGTQVIHTPRLTKTQREFRAADRP